MTSSSPSRIFVLKARQVGISTLTAMFFLHRILFRSNTHAIMPASAQVEQSTKLNMIIDTAWDRLPFWLLRRLKIGLKAKEPRWDNGSALSIQAGSQTVGIAQGVDAYLPAPQVRACRLRQPHQDD